MILTEEQKKAGLWQAGITVIAPPVKQEPPVMTPEQEAQLTASIDHAIQQIVIFWLSRRSGLDVTKATVVVAKALRQAGRSGNGGRGRTLQMATEFVLGKVARNELDRLVK